MSYDPVEAERVDLLAMLATYSRYAQMHYQAIGRWIQEKDRLRRWARAWKQAARKKLARVFAVEAECDRDREAFAEKLHDVGLDYAAALEAETALKAERDRLRAFVETVNRLSCTGPRSVFCDIVDEAARVLRGETPKP